MTIVVSLLVGGVLGWFGRDLVPMARRALEQRRSARAQGAAIHTMKGSDEWEVRQEGAEEPLATFPTKAEAQAAGRERAKEAATEHVVHRVDDTVSERHDYSDGDPSS